MPHPISSILINSWQLFVIYKWPGPKFIDHQPTDGGTSGEPGPEYATFRTRNIYYSLSFLSNKSFKILSLLSGIRREDGRYDLKTDYTAVYKTLKKRDNIDMADEFAVSLIVKQIISCNYFDLDMYVKFQAVDGKATIYKEKKIKKKDKAGA